MARLREFDPKAALDRILAQFWAGGYHATSLQDLEAATGLKKQSLYREFGNKDAMFAAALGLYGEREFRLLEDVLMAADAPRARFTALFDAVLAPVRKGDRRGCFLCNTAIEHASDDPKVQTKTQAGIAATHALFARALVGFAQPSHINHRLVAGYFGLRVMVRGGVPLPDLEAYASALVNDI